MKFLVELSLNTKRKILHEIGVDIIDLHLKVYFCVFLNWALKPAGFKPKSRDSRV